MASFSQEMLPELNYLLSLGETPVLSGFLDKKGRINPEWKRRLFVLTKQHLYYFIPRPTSSQVVLYRGRIDLLYVVAIQELESEVLGATFSIETLFRTYSLRVTDGDQTDKKDFQKYWISELEKVTKHRIDEVASKSPVAILKTIARHSKLLLNATLSSKAVSTLPPALSGILQETQTFLFLQKVVEANSNVWIRSTAWLDTFHPCGAAWLKLSRPSLMSKRAFSADVVETLCNIGIDAEVNDQIERDLPRTFSSIEYFRDPDVINSTRRVLVAVAVQMPKISYVQGMNFIVAYLFLHVKSEFDCFSLFMNMLLHPKYNLSSVFAEGLPNLIPLSEIIVHALQMKSAQLYEHLEQIGLGGMFFTYQWILTLLTYNMPFDEVAKVWTLFFNDGWSAMVKAFLLLILDEENFLLQADFEEAFAHIRDAPSRVGTDFAVRVSKLELDPIHETMIRNTLATSQD